MNPQFLERIQSYIPQEMEAFEESLNRPLYQGLRYNPLKSTPAFLQSSLPFLQAPSPFAEGAWYIRGSYGLHPYHLQGRYYLQEPSAGSAVGALELKPEDTVLDLCAAPGSKSTQIAGQVSHGFLVSNEIDPKRAQVLLSNMERTGAENFAVTNMDAAGICRQFPETFDKILVDAPCSGEGMMKKHAAARDEWSLENVKICAARQKEILKEACSALRPGGRLVYSTCTYAREENEDNVAWLLDNFPDFYQVPVKGEYGRPGLETDGMDASMVRRIFPMDQGEGHFIAAFEKRDSGQEKKTPAQEKPARLEPAAADFLKDQLPGGYTNYCTRKTKENTVQVFGMNHPFWKFKKGKVLRQGVYLGDVIKKRFEPAHAFYMSASMQHPVKSVDVSLQEMDAFVHGQQMNRRVPRGWLALTYQGLPFGFGKSDGTRITNKYPKGLRLLPDSHLLVSENIETGTSADTSTSSSDRQKGDSR